MSNRAMLERRYPQHSVVSWKMRDLPRQKRVIRRMSQLSYGMGMGANALIHKGRKP